MLGLLSDYSMCNKAYQFLHIKVITVVVKSLTVSAAVVLYPLETPRERLFWL